MRDSKINQLESTKEIVEYINYVELNQILISEQPYVGNYTTDFFFNNDQKARDMKFLYLSQSEYEEFKRFGKDSQLNIYEFSTEVKPL